MTCARIRRLADRYFADGLTSREQRKIDRHLIRCPECWDWFDAADPVRIFRNLAPPAGDDRFWADFWPRIRSDIEAPAAPAWVLGWRPAAAVAAGLLTVAIVVGGWALLRDTATTGEVPTAARSVDRAVSSTLVRHTAAPPTVESLPSADSRVFEFQLQEPSGPPTEVILIFDESIDL
jgi:predicted anti-sigma-YlaC factor YlaD